MNQIFRIDLNLLNTHHNLYNKNHRDLKQQNQNSKIKIFFRQPIKKKKLLRINLIPSSNKPE